MTVSNSCDCPNPPGGRAVCAPHQVAICIVLDGVARQECHNPPSSTDATLLVNWALTKVIGTARLPDEGINASDLQTLLAGNFERRTGERVTYAFPATVTEAIHRLLITKVQGGPTNASNAAEARS
jgi:hypothetical protein